jgi:pimeloyl-ACP methyl ester carboxylesterase
VSSPTRLPPAQWFPAGRDDITVRQVALPDGTSMRILEAGAADAPPVLLIHGWAISAYLWRHTIPAIAHAGFRAIAVDLPGCGLSSAPTAKGSYSLDCFATRIIALLDVLGVEHAPIVAQSMGGRIAVEVARRVPQRITKLALYGAVGFGDVPPAQVFAPFIPKLPGDLPSLLVTRQTVDIVQRRVHGKLGWFTDRDTDEYWAPTQFPDVVRAQLQMLVEFEWAPLTPAVLATIMTPTMVVFGTEDKTVRPGPTERIVAGMPHAQLRWIEGGGHVVMEETPDLVNAELTAFLAQ